MSLSSHRPHTNERITERTLAIRHRNGLGSEGSAMRFISSLLILSSKSSSQSSKCTRTFEFDLETIRAVCQLSHLSWATIDCPTDRALNCTGVADTGTASLSWLVIEAERSITNRMDLCTVRVFVSLPLRRIVPERDSFVSGRR